MKLCLLENVTKQSEMFTSLFDEEKHNQLHLNGKVKAVHYNCCWFITLSVHLGVNVCVCR